MGTKNTTPAFSFTDDTDAGYFYAPYVPLQFSAGGAGLWISNTYYPPTTNVHEVMAKELRKAFTRVTTYDPWVVKIKTRYDG